MIAHNSRRMLHNTSIISWDESLEKVAVSRANVLANAQTLSNDPDTTYGESTFKYCETVTNLCEVATEQW